MDRRHLIAVLVLLAAAAALVTCTAASAGKPKHRQRHRKKSPPAAVAPDPYAAVLTKYLAGRQPIFCGGGEGPYVAFTFDDGPGPLTQQLLDFLQQQHVPATFFDIGQQIAGRESIVTEESQIAVVGDHTWTHPQLPSLESTPGAVLSELQRTKDAIAAATGRPPRIFRAPFGQRDPAIDAIAKSIGLLDVEWSVVVQDGADADVIYSNLVSRVVAGSIVLMHENDHGEIEGFERALPVLLARGYVPVTVLDLLLKDPPPDDMPSWAGQCVAHWTPPATTP
ncbi:MAG TPA: polysaccharide deacetylase family protein [Gaiellaceae bacterium]|nr:polysaccharide deacetylase family protein [Gaiellaceae bacterium]